MSERRYTLLDQALIQINHALTTVHSHLSSHRPNPSAHTKNASLTPTEKKHSAGLMRVNHAGEVCAQALYRGQWSVARESKTREMLANACEEETDHLAWTHERLKELNSHRSVLSPFWYANAFFLGVIAGLAGDRWSLGFIEETEIQVTKHLEGHLNKLSENDQKSRQIVAQMRDDEAEHSQAAANAGANELPLPVKKLMTLHAKVMTLVAYYV